MANDITSLNEQTENSVDTTENVTVQEVSTDIQLEQIHNDLGIIVSFLIFFTLVIVLRYSFKFFDMIFKY